MGTASKILIVNSDITDLSITSILFSKKGYKVFAAKNNTIAKNYLITAKPDVVICDMAPHDYSNENTVGFLHDVNLMNIPLLVASGTTLSINKLFNSNTKLLGFFSKPFFFEDLLVKINEITQQA